MKTPTQDSEPLLLRLQDDGGASENSGGSVMDLFYIASASLSLVALLAFAIMEPPVPEPNPGSFSVTRLNISKTVLSGVWELDLAFSGRDWGVNGVFFESLEGVIFYGGDIPLALTWAEPFALGSKELGKVSLRFENPGLEAGQPLVEKGVLREMKRDQEMGMVNFSLRINCVVRDAQGWDFLWPVTNCWDLAVRFEHNSGVGRLINASRKQCRSW